MSPSQHRADDTGENGVHRRSLHRLALGVAAAVAAGGALAGFALAASSTPTVRATRNSTLNETVVVSGTSGRTLYWLSPETTHHLLCKSNACFSAWPPLFVRSHSTKLVAGSGVHGRLALLQRSNGKWQVTLRGVPLYMFSGDSARGQANGDGIMSFGGTWHAVTASSGSSTTAPTNGSSSGSSGSGSGTSTGTSTPTTTSTPYPGYSY